MIFRHILTAYDGSKQSEKALDKAIRLAKTNPNTRLTVAHALNLQSVMIGEALLPVPEGYRDRLRDHADGILKRAADRIKLLPRASVVLLETYPAAGLLEYAETHGCDLIVMGSRGLGPIREFVLGSVSHNVVQHAKMPVMIVK